MPLPRDFGQLDRMENGRTQLRTNPQRRVDSPVFGPQIIPIGVVAGDQVAVQPGFDGVFSHLDDRRMSLAIAGGKVVNGSGITLSRLTVDLLEAGDGALPAIE